MWNLVILTPLVILAALAIPGINSYEMASRERKAKDRLRLLVQAEAEFRSKDRDQNGIADYWTGDVASLCFLQVGGKEMGLIDRTLARADARALHPLPGGPVPLDGYYFVAMERDVSGSGTVVDYRIDTDQTGRKVHHGSKFGFCAYPAIPNAGLRTYIVNESGVVLRRAGIPEPILEWKGEPDFPRPMH